jgi:acetyltransferase-like isoleucine patch superfamily enzyme
MPPPAADRGPIGPPETVQAWKRRTVLAVLVAALPGKLRVLAGRWLLGWDVHPTATVGHTVLAARKVTLGPGAKIASGNMIKGLEELRLDADAAIGPFNWISGPPLPSGRFSGARKRRPALVMEESASIASRHHIDCSDTVTLAPFATLGGSRTTIYTHSVNLVANRQRTAPVHIGERSAVLTHCVILAGMHVPARSIVSAGSVVNTLLTKELTFYVGNPAQATRDLPEDLGYFTRTQGFIE